MSTETIDQTGERGVRGPAGWFQRAGEFLREVRNEMKRVTWPSQREVYATSGDRILLWFDLLNPPGGSGPAPMGSEVRLAEAPRFSVRAVGAFLRLTPSEGGWRIVVVDSADDLNRNSANALLKVLEEPPRQALLMLVSHAPGRLLPTIRSRCRTVALRSLEDGEVSQLLRRYRPETDPEEEAILIRLAERGHLETAWEHDVPPGRPPRHLYRLSHEGAELAAKLRGASMASERARSTARPALEGSAG